MAAIFNHVTSAYQEYYFRCTGRYMLQLPAFSMHKKIYHRTVSTKNNKTIEPPESFGDWGFIPVTVRCSR